MNTKTERFDGEEEGKHAIFFLFAVSLFIFLLWCFVLNVLLISIMAALLCAALGTAHCVLWNRDCLDQECCVSCWAWRRLKNAYR